MANPANIIEVEDLYKTYGPLRAVNRISFSFVVAAHLFRRESGAGERPNLDPFLNLSLQ